MHTTNHDIIVIIIIIVISFLSEKEFENTHAHTHTPIHIHNPYIDEREPDKYSKRFSIAYFIPQYAHIFISSLLMPMSHEVPKIIPKLVCRILIFENGMKKKKKKNIEIKSNITVFKWLYPGAGIPQYFSLLTLFAAHCRLLLGLIIFIEA